jgi:hypothetical protein
VTRVRFCHVDGDTYAGQLVQADRCLTVSLRTCARHPLTSRPQNRQLGFQLHKAFVAALAVCCGAVNVVHWSTRGAAGALSSFTSINVTERSSDSKTALVASPPHQATRMCRLTSSPSFDQAPVEVMTDSVLAAA